MSEVRRLLLCAREPPSKRRFQQWWSTFRRRHQATARRCHAAGRARRRGAVLTGVDATLLVSTTRELDDALWERIVQILPAPRHRGAQPPLDYRTLLGGILWVAETGAAWQDVPTAFGPWETVKAVYYRWKQHGHWPQVLALLQAPQAPTP